MIKRISGSWGRGEVYQSINNMTIRPNVNQVVMDVMLLRYAIYTHNHQRVLTTIAELIEEKWLTHEMAAKVLTIMRNFTAVLIGRKEAFKEVRNCFCKKDHNAYYS